MRTMQAWYLDRLKVKNKKLTYCSKKSRGYLSKKSVWKMSSYFIMHVECSKGWLMFSLKTLVMLHFFLKMNCLTIFANFNIFWTAYCNPFFSSMYNVHCLTFPLGTKGFFQLNCGVKRWGAFLTLKICHSWNKRSNSRKKILTVFFRPKCFDFFMY